MKARKGVGVYLEDIRRAVERIEEYTAKGKRDFLTDPKTQDAVIRQLAIIGEAAKSVPLVLRRKHAAVPWKQIVGMRNILIHDYSETNLDTVWVTVKQDLPQL